MVDASRARTMKGDPVSKAPSPTLSVEGSITTSSPTSSVVFKHKSSALHVVDNAERVQHLSNHEVFVGPYRPEMTIVTRQSQGGLVGVRNSCVADLNDSLAQQMGVLRRGLLDIDAVAVFIEPDRIPPKTRCPHSTGE